MAYLLAHPECELEIFGRLFSIEERRYEYKKMARATGGNATPLYSKGSPNERAVALFSHLREAANTASQVNAATSSKTVKSSGKWMTHSQLETVYGADVVAIEMACETRDAGSPHMEGREAVFG